MKPPLLVADQILPDFKFRVGQITPDGVKGYAVIGGVHSIGFVIAHAYRAVALECEKHGFGEVCSSKPMQNPYIPGPDMSVQRRREAVERKQDCRHPSFMSRIEHRCYGCMVGGMDGRDPGAQVGIIERAISSDCRAVGLDRHGVLPFGIAIAIDHQPGVCLMDERRV